MMNIQNPVRIIPCLDIKDGRVVKGIGFENLQDMGDPVTLAKLYEQEGADELVILDIAATVEKRTHRMSLLKEVLAAVNIPVSAGGGFSSLEVIDEAIALGAAKVALSNAAVVHPDLLANACNKYPGQIVLAIDVLRHPSGEHTVLIEAGKVDTGISLANWAQNALKIGVAEILLTSKGADGGKQGYDIEATKLTAQTGLPVIASGGAGTLEDFYKAAACGARGLLAASVFHQKTFTSLEIKRDLAARGIPVCGVPLLPEGSLIFNDQGLIPAIAQDARSGEVLMQAYMSPESLEETLRTGLATYYSRSRGMLWQKGSTSGNTQRVLRIDVDCDGDSLLLTVVPNGPACHTGEMSCFYRTYTYQSAQSAPGSRILGELQDIIRDRMEHPIDGSYTNYLLSRGVDKISKKTVEEAAELIIAAKNQSKEGVKAECADLLYHVLVLLTQQNVDIQDVFATLATRH